MDYLIWRIEYYLTYAAYLVVTRWEIQFLIAFSILLVSYLRWRSAFIAQIVFYIAFVGSMIIPYFLLPWVFGELSQGNPATNARIWTDFTISFVFTIIAAYVGCVISEKNKIMPAIIGIFLYFILLLWTHFLDSPELVGIWPAWSDWLMQIKIPIGGALGIYLFLKSRAIKNTC